MQRCTVILKTLQTKTDSKQVTGIDKFVKWTDKWQVKLNIDMCKVIFFHCWRHLIIGVLPTDIWTAHNSTVLEEVEEI